MKAEYTFTWQLEQRALYAKIVVEVGDSIEPKWQLDVPNNISPTWKAGISFGFEVFVERLSQTDRRNSHDVKIVEIDGQPCDTTVAVIAYTTFVALTNALKAKIETPLQFNDVEGRFIF